MTGAMADDYDGSAARGAVANVCAFRHEALFYAGPEEFVGGTLPFIGEALAAGEPTLVAVSAAKADLLRGGLEREGLGGREGLVRFVDMERLGRNPGRIIAAWREFVEEHAGRGAPLRGIGEPVWPGRSASELVECRRHESLLNLAFGRGPAFWLMCPYDTEALDVDVIEDARSTHPFVLAHGAHGTGGVDHASNVYRPPDPCTEMLGDALPPPPRDRQELDFTPDRLGALRELLRALARDAGLDSRREADLLLAVGELTANSLLHGGGRGTLLIWREPEALVCEVRDAGRIEDPLVGRARPKPEALSGRGLWIVNELCDLVELRSTPTGTVARVRIAVKGAQAGTSDTLHACLPARATTTHASPLCVRATPA